jgi:hypothetical protein
MIEYKLTVEKVNLIIKGLRELPAKESMSLILELQTEGQRQFEEQNKPKMQVEKQ